jgi:hypothetical protein
MKKIFIASLLLLSASTVFAQESARTHQNWDGSSTTNYSDGTSSTTRKNWDNSQTTRFSDGSSARTHENWDGSTTTTFSD